jgi:hypothetical protein
MCVVDVYVYIYVIYDFMKKKQNTNKMIIMRHHIITFPTPSSVTVSQKKKN